MSGFDSSDEENEENVRPIEPFRNHTLTMRGGTKYEREGDELKQIFPIITFIKYL